MDNSRYKAGQKVYLKSWAAIMNQVVDRKNSDSLRWGNPSKSAVFIKGQSQGILKDKHDKYFGKPIEIVAITRSVASSKGNYWYNTEFQHFNVAEWFIDHELTERMKV